MLSHRLVRSVVAAGLAVVAAAGILAQTPTYKVDPAHSSVGFSIRHLLTQVQGKFNEFEGSVVYDPAQPEASRVEFTVQAKSIDTGNARRDDHLRSADFFDVAKYPTLSFRSEKVVAKGKDEVEVTGPFTMHGVTKTITVPGKILGIMKTEKFGQRAGFESSFTVSRKEFGITWNQALDAGSMVLGDEVRVTINVEAVLQGSAEGSLSGKEAKPAQPKTQPPAPVPGR